MRALVARRVEGWAMQGEFDVHPATRELAFAAIATTLGGFADDARSPVCCPVHSDARADSRGRTGPGSPPAREAPLRDELESRLLRTHIAGRTNTEATGLPGHLRRQARSFPETRCSRT
jgi:cytochrome P450